MLRLQGLQDTLREVIKTSRYVNETKTLQYSDEGFEASRYVRDASAVLKLLGLQFM